MRKKRGAGYKEYTHIPGERFGNDIGKLLFGRKSKSKSPIKIRENDVMPFIEKDFKELSKLLIDKLDLQTILLHLKKYEKIFDSLSYKALKPFVPFLQNINEKEIKSILNMDLSKVDNKDKLKIYSILLCSYINLLEGLEKNHDKKKFYPILIKHLDKLKDNNVIKDTEFKNKLISCLPDNYESYKSPKRSPKRSVVRSPTKSLSKSPTRTPKKLTTDSPTRSPKKSPKRSNSKKDSFLNKFKFFK